MLLTLFDKSFLQSLSLDESVWFDQFFSPIISPMFYVETLADLSKQAKREKHAEDTVRIIAQKFPDLHSVPHMHHQELCTAELLGQPIPMTGNQVVRSGARPVKSADRSGFIFDNDPEAAAFSKWQDEKFHEVEREFASTWREMNSRLDLDSIAVQLKKLGVCGRTYKTLQDAKSLAERLVAQQTNSIERMYLALLYIGIPQRQHSRIFERWKLAGYPPMPQYVPYSTHVFTVSLFFDLSLASDLISTKRASNWIDVSYLFYLPFCRLFVSSDKLHRRCAPLFLRSDQEFIWGELLKSGLQELNAHYVHLPEHIKRKGVMSFASHPPKTDEYFVSRLWDKHLPRWRTKMGADLSNSEFKESELAANLNEFVNAPTIDENEVDFDIRNPDAMVIKRMVRKKKGQWWQIPHDHKVEE